MPPRIQELLQDRRIQIALGAVVLGVVLLLVFLRPWAPSGEAGDPILKEDQLNLATVTNLGRAIEIQALLAREGIQVDRRDADGGKATVVFEKGTTASQRDQALIALVQSGLMDKNVGLEAFEKGDLTASREEKRIKLIRAQQGELARLIRKIQPIEDASVNLSIPDPSIFKEEQKPMSASVQVNLPTGTRLTRDQVRSIMNLVVGSVQDLDSSHVALSDTNGNTYNSVLSASAEMDDKLSERDEYMRQKVAAQLDRLVGPGHYVVTVSTQLREATQETLRQTFDPARSAVSSKQQFSENLNSEGGHLSSGGAVSSFLPKELSTTYGKLGAVSEDRGYRRVGEETAYANGQVQTLETHTPGSIEDVSVAVTIDRNFFPGLETMELQRLLAHAASPMVNPDNVSIAQTDFQRPVPLPSGEGFSGSAGFFGKNQKWMPWAMGAVVVCVLLVAAMAMGGRSSGGGTSASRQEVDQARRAIEELRQVSAQQQAQLQAAQEQTQRLVEAQRQQLTGGGAPAVAGAQPVASSTAPSGAVGRLDNTVEQLREAVASGELDPDELELESWIESA